MAILLPYEVNPNMGNKFLWYFYNSLKNENVDIIASQEAWINKSENFQAILIHWPEYLPYNNFFNNHYDFINFSIERINYFKDNSKIFYFVHNILPHRDQKGIYKNLYESLIQNSTAIFNFGYYSKHLYEFKYKKVANQFIVPHGNFIDLDKEKEDKTILEKLSKINSSAITVSVIGAIRNKIEFKILKNFAKFYLKKGCNFIYAGKINKDFFIDKRDGKIKNFFKNKIFMDYGYKKFITKLRKNNLKNLDGNITVFHKYISDDLLVKICKKSDILLICRNEILNSGNVALGFTFGCFVVGPDKGIVGEILRKNKNIVFDTKNINYQKIVSTSLNSLNSSIRNDNRKEASINWNWSLIAKKYKKIFEELI